MPASPQNVQDYVAACGDPAAAVEIEALLIAWLLTRRKVKPRAIRTTETTGSAGAAAARVLCWALFLAMAIVWGWLLLQAGLVFLAFIV